MAEKLLRKLQQYSKTELMAFLQKNGYDEFGEILSNGDITTGEKFLNLTELQIIKWKLPPAIKKKLMSLLKEIKENPQKFMSETEKSTTLTRRMSLRTNTDFKEKLEQMMTSKPLEVKQVKLPAPPPKEEPTPLIVKKSAASLPKIEKERAPSPPQEYLPMVKEKMKSLNDHFDDSGYLIPVDKSQQMEENDYEDLPSDRIITGFTSVIHRGTNENFSRRAPLALPRDSTDDRGYIQGPEDLATPTVYLNDSQFFPRVQINPRGGEFNPKMKSPTTAPTPQLPKVVVQSIQNEEEEEVVYEPIDDEPLPSRLSPEPTSMDMQTGSLSRLFGLGFLKKAIKLDGHNYKQNEIKVKREVEKSDYQKPAATNVERKNQFRKITNRPLPPLPPSESSFTASKPKEVNVTLDEPLDEYENIHEGLSEEDKRRLHTQLSNALNLKDGFRNEKSKSDSNLATDEEPVTYGNIDDNNIPKHPGSYEHPFFKNAPGKRQIQLPLPPISLPQLRVEETRCPENTDNEEELEEYGNFIFNINDEPFYRNTDRKGAKQLLSTLGDGAFLFRPSTTYFLTLSLKYNNQYHNLGIIKTDNNKIRLEPSGDNMSPEFATLTDFVDYFTREEITFESKGRTIETYLRKTLPPHIF